MAAIRLKGPKALLAVVVIVALGGAKLLSPTLSVEDRAQRSIETWLRNDLGGELGRQIQASTPAGATIQRAKELAGQAQAITELEIVSLDARRASDHRLVVRTRYRTTPYGATETVYLMVRQRGIGDWSVEREASAWQWHMSALHVL
jgi:hypothetical protein